MRVLSLLTLAVILLGIIAIALPIPTTVLAQEKKGPASDKLIYKAIPLQNAPDALGKEIDIYLFHLRPHQAKELRGKPGIKLYSAPAGLVNYDINPAPVYIANYSGVLTKEEVAAREGVPVAAITYYKVNRAAGWTYVEFGAHPKYGINPFAFRQVRFALNYLFDRKYVVENIYGGFAAPMYTFLSVYDPTYTIIADIVAKYKFRYAPDVADKLISSILTAVGAKRIGGKWYYEGKPIKITFIIRTEDERKELGDMLATELEKIGFEVDRKYMTFGQAISIVYASDPKELKWHIYTAGWGKGALDKWDMVTINQFGAPWFGWLPGYGEAEWWNYKNETIDELGKRIYFGKFKSKEEYIALYREATEMIIQESVRVWIATTMDVYSTVTELKGVTLDLGAGLRGIWNPREWYVPGKTEVRVGHLHVWTARTVWNIYGGFDDVYSVDIERATYDPFIWAHPFSGERIPFRAGFEVETAGPTGKLDVPPDAVKWDAEHDKWVPVGEGVKATSKVIFDLSKLIGAKWHHGQTITWADVLAAWAELWDISCDKEKSALESAIASTSKPWFDTVKAIRILPDEKKLEVYVDYWHFDPAYIADYATLNIVNPAELIFVQDYLAFTLKKYALDETRAEKEKIPQLNLVLSGHAADVKKAAEEILSKGILPEGVFTVNGKSYMTTDEWKARLNALIKWIDAYGTAWVSQGPFKLVKFDKDKQIAVLEAFRDPTYPFKPGDWYFGIPKPVKIVDVKVPTIYPGQEAKIEVDVEGVPPIDVIYILRDTATGAIITSGHAAKVTETKFEITFTKELTAKLKVYTPYELEILAFSEKVSMPTSTSKIIVPSTAAVEKRIEEVSKHVEEVTGALGKRVEEVTKRVEEMSRRVEEISKATAEQVASVREELTKKLGTLGETLGKSIEALSKTLTESLGKTTKELTETLGSSVKDIGSTVKDLGKTVAEVSGKVDKLSGDVSKLKSDLEGVKSTVEDLGSRVDDLSSKVDSLSSALTTTQALVGVALVLEFVIIALLFRRR